MPESTILLTYSQTKGEWRGPAGELLVDNCYAGMDGVKVGAQILNGKNNPDYQDLRNVGPLPQGIYTISPLHTIPHLGPAMCLTPSPANQMFGRSGFFFHLTDPAHPEASSDGCICARDDPGTTSGSIIDKAPGSLSGWQKQQVIAALLGKPGWLHAIVQVMVIE